MYLMKTILLLASCSALLVVGGAVANANSFENNSLPLSKIGQARVVQEVQFTTGKILEVKDNMLVVKDERGIVAALLNDETYLLNGKNGKAKKLSSFKVGKEVTVYHSPKMTRSIPAQTQAYAIILGDNDVKQGKFFVVDQVTTSENGEYVSVMDSSHSLIATVDKKAYRYYSQIKAGDKLLVWYDMMTMSLPARTNAQKVVVLPQN
ncbi:MAG: DUF3221 domain-containing protein [Phascolarctobacterium sp.]|nr:DUF3221 domain-containing protein [Phascolarctobacterium sp.]